MTVTTPQDRWAKLADLVSHLMANPDDANAFKENNKPRMLDILAAFELTLADVLLSADDIKLLVPEGSPVWSV